MSLQRKRALATQVRRLSDHHFRIAKLLGATPGALLSWVREVIAGAETRRPGTLTHENDNYYPPHSLHR